MQKEGDLPFPIHPLFRKRLTMMELALAAGSFFFFIPPKILYFFGFSHTTHILKKGVSHHVVLSAYVPRPQYFRTMYNHLPGIHPDFPMRKIPLAQATHSLPRLPGNSLPLPRLVLPVGIQNYRIVQQNWRHLLIFFGGSA